MATLTLSVAAMTKSMTIAAGDVSRWLEAYRGRFGLPPTATNEQIFDQFATWLFDYANASVLMQEKEVAARDAAQNVPPIPLIPI
jgi:hypothetical protein